MTTGDTIVALATPATPARRAIVRTSGPRAVAAARHLAPALDPAPGSAVDTHLTFADLTCPAWVYVFLGPGSVTGEDVVEYHLPGSPILARLLIDHLLTAGLRPADPGEFTARGYFAGKLDLTAAEGVAATISAANAADLAAARQLLAGELARRLRPITDAVADLLSLVEVGIDFSEEDVAVVTTADRRRRIAALHAAVAVLESAGVPSGPTAHRPQFVLAGRPNAGKSTLLNALAGQPRAIVSPVAGTTRDALSAPVDLPGGVVDVVDVAGLASDRLPAPVVDTQMQGFARRAIGSADHVVYVCDITEPEPPPPLPRDPDLTVWSKADLLVGPQSPAAVAGGPAVEVSAVTGHGLDSLRRAMDALAFGPSGRPVPGARLTLNVRHLQALAAASRSLANAAEQSELELVAADLRAALDAVGSITGVVSPDHVLGRVFSTFCIGK